MAKSRLDLILDKVKAKQHEVTLDVSSYTKEQKDKIRDTAKGRGFDVAEDNRHMLIRDLRDNPSLPKGKFIPCKAVKINSNGSVSVRL
jgi:hypothetical protein